MKTKQIKIGSKYTDRRDGELYTVTNIRAYVDPPVMMLVVSDGRRDILQRLETVNDLLLAGVIAMEVGQ